ncbi:MAG: tRNA (N6-isopentenyl adenosine(37)-C2)-methylthiotransferase MiaB [Bacteroidia bacterium]
MRGILDDKIIDEQRQGETLDLPIDLKEQGKKKLYIESYGCQMNFADSEIVASVMIENGFTTTKELNDADLVLVNTCAIRDNAEQRVRNRLDHFNSAKKKNPGMLVGVMGCMAERLKTKLLEEEKVVDIVVGPDAYRDLPQLVETAESGQKAVNVFLSREETYADISPIRLDSNGVTAFVSIMRGCDNMCSFCVVPFTRGRERSRNPNSIVSEAQELFAKGYKEVTLLGQNVDSYKWKTENEDTVNFAELLEMVALVSPELRVRFSTSHPKDITEDVVYSMKKHDNICNFIHLPVQSGNSRILDKMNRTYDREWYLNRVDMIRSIIPDIAFSTDVICGFCSETEEEHEDTLSLMEKVKFDHAYMFIYSERPGTLAARKYEDDISEKEKKRRLSEVITLQSKHALASNQRDLGKIFRVLIEGVSKKNKDDLKGRNDQNKMLVFPAKGYNAGDYVNVKVNDCTSATLIGEIVD